MTAESSYSLEALERQWRATKAPKLGLQLAEEHRRRDDLPAAIAVLEAGLEAHPDHRSSRVALSRYLVVSERYESALEHLRRIVEVDPVHLVANKLMVRAYLGLGRLEEARDKLDIYEMLGEGDSDIEGLRAALESASPAAADETAAGIEAEAAPGLEVEPEPAAATVAAEAEDFRLERAPELPEPLSDPFVAVPEKAPAIPFELVDEEESSEPSPAGSVDEPFGSVWTAARPEESWDTVVDERIFSVDSGAAEELSVEELFGNAESESAPIETMAVEPAESTVTLGNLYLEQGDPERAARSFRDVLVREPGNAAARQGLESVEVLAASGAEPASVKERKMAVLIEYRARLRRAVEAHN